MDFPRGWCVALAFFLWVPIGFADDHDCMAKNIYWESRNQTVNAMYAVAEVVMSRVRDRRWPDNSHGIAMARATSHGSITVGKGWRGS